MYHNTRLFTTALHLSLENHSEALQNAALLLGDRPALRRTQRLLDDLATQPVLTGRIDREARALYALLTLENVHDFDRVEATCFALLDPALPVIEDICLLADGLRSAMQKTGIECDVFGSEVGPEAPQSMAVGS